MKPPMRRVAPDDAAEFLAMVRVQALHAAIASKAANGQLMTVQLVLQRAEQYETWILREKT